MLADSLDLQGIQSGAFSNNKIPSDLGGLISNLLPYVFAAAGIGLLIYMVSGGLSMMLSKGDPKALQTAQGKITNALIGFIIVAFSFVIVRLIGQLLGVDAFRPIFGF